MSILKIYQNLPKDKTNSLRKEAEEYINKSIKPTLKEDEVNLTYNKYIDDTLRCWFMDKNKSVLQYTDDAWEAVAWNYQQYERNFRNIR